MAKKELRLAVVIYGGASLAVYMHGVTKELIKLVRASKVLHEMGAAASSATYSQGPDRRPPDTEAIYFEILQAIQAKDDFRVVIDVIAGASAGAINGVMLAKALVDDGRLDAQTPLWLDGADSESLAAEDVGRWRKWYLYPVLRTLARWLPREVAANPETQRKLARLVRASWFRPPLSGERLCHLFFDGLEALRTSRREGSTLLPPGQRLDVFASVTDLAGYPRAIHLDDAVVARDKEHAAFCQLSHTGGMPGGVTPVSDFADDNVAALVWAARASSSYAGAFPPFRHDELLRVARGRGLPWPGEEHFLADRLRARDGSPLSAHVDPVGRWFVDGGIVNNKPFGVVLEALNHRPADRQVYRRLVYIEPDPVVSAGAGDTRLAGSPGLGYLGMLHAATSTIPRNQPIVEALNTIVALDARVRVNRRVIEAHRQRIADLTAEQSRIHAAQPLSGDLVTYLRQALEDQAEVEMGIAFEGYVQRRLWLLVDSLVDAWSGLAGRRDSALTGAVERLVGAWWATPPAGDDRADRRQQRRQYAFLERFDVSYRLRRLQFVIRRINELEADRALPAVTVDALDTFKQRVYAFTERCYRLRRVEFLDPALLAELRLAAMAPPAAQAGQRLLGRLADALGLENLDRTFDSELAALLDEPAGAPLRETLLSDYVGFPFFDVLLMGPGMPEESPDPLTPIRIDRISPADAPALGSAFHGLRSRELMGFLGFFNRVYREHDYLWGRLNGAERLVDLLVDAVGEAVGDPRALKRALFERILAVERERLPGCADDLDAIAAVVSQMG